MEINKKLEKLESEFKVKYPVLENATYKSLVNYASDLDKKIQRWYRYKEGYSEILVKEILDYYKVISGDVILDPFAGSGSTIVEAKKRGCKCIGYEVNPFSNFLCRVKTQNYSKSDQKDFEALKKEVLSKVDKYKPSKVPKLSISEKLFPVTVLKYLLRMKNLIHESKSSTRAKDLAKLAWLGSLEELSNYRKAGNGLKKRKSKNYKEATVNDVKDYLLKIMDAISEDLSFAIDISKKASNPLILQKSSLEMKEVKSSSVKGIIFSPPYANCFDYTEIYKVELWFGDFVKDNSDLKPLRRAGVRSNLNGLYFDGKVKKIQIKELEDIVSELRKKDLWDKRIPDMVSGYFSDMFKSIDEAYRVLRKKGFCAIVVSNSSYGGTIIPTDLLLAKYAKKIGFKVREIDAARFIITSSQQYHKTVKYKKFLRESIIYLEKNG